MSSLASDNTGSEFNNNIVTETEESDYGTVKPSSPSGMLVLMQIMMIFIFLYVYVIYNLSSNSSGTGIKKVSKKVLEEG